MRAEPVRTNSAPGPGLTPARGGVKMVNKRIVWPLMVTLILAVEGSGVKLVAAAGITLTTHVPQLVGMETPEASMSITAAGLTLGSVTGSWNAVIPAGTVVSQDPPAGTVVTKGSSVNLSISLGPGTLAQVPNVVGWSQSGATAAITAAGLTVGTITYSPPGVGQWPGEVIHQDPSGGTQVAKGSGVNLVIASDPAVPTTVPVPNVVGMSPSGATAAITAAGLTVGTITYSPPGVGQWPGEVIHQDPPGGTQAAKGSGVNLVVTSDPAVPDAVGVPNVVGMAQMEAASAITAAGLLVKVTLVSSGTVPPGSVISQDPAAGMQVASGSVVNLTVSTASAPAGPVPGGPVAHWKLDETQGAMALDSAGGHFGVLYGNPTWLPTGGRIGGALSFDGIDDHVNGGTFNPSAATGKLSVCVWARWNGQPRAWQGLIAKRNKWGDGKTMWSLEADINTGKLGFFHETSIRFGGDPVLPIGTWAHVAVTFDGTTATLYVNGEPTGSGPFSLPSDTQAPVVFGASEPDGANAFNGALDDIQLYDQALSRTQIQAVMTGAEAKPGAAAASLLAHWTFDETTGRIAADSAGTCDGVLVGGPVWQPAGGKVGGALKFDGVNDCVVTNFVLDPAHGPFSVFAWVNGGAAGQVILSQDGSVGGTDWLAASATGRLATTLGGGKSLTSTKIIIDGQWHEVGLTWDGTSRTLYVDGTAAATDKPSVPVSSAGGLNIGVGSNLDPGTFWSGLIDDIRVYNRAVQP